MEILWGNLSFTLINISVILILWALSVAAVNQLVKLKHVKVKDARRLNYVVAIIVVGIIIFTALAGIRSKGVKFTLQDSLSNNNPYEAGEMQDLSPELLTDEERVQQNQDLINQNKN